MNFIPALEGLIALREQVFQINALQAITMINYMGERWRIASCVHWAMNVQLVRLHEELSVDKATSALRDLHLCSILAQQEHMVAIVQVSKTRVSANHVLQVVIVLKQPLLQSCHHLVIINPTKE
jgi:hypothetical protein